MRRILSSALLLALVSGMPVFAAGGSIAGTALMADGRSATSATLRLRSLTTGLVAGSTASSATGAFSFSSVPAGSYAVEVLDANGSVAGASSMLTIGANGAVNGINVIASATAAQQTAGTTVDDKDTSGNKKKGALLWWGVIAAGAGVAATVAVVNEASPLR